MQYITNMSYLLFAIHIFRILYHPIHYGVNLVPHDLESWEIVVRHYYLLYVCYIYLCIQ